MAEARSRAAWAHTSSVLAMLANVNRDPKRTRAFRPEDFDPHSRKDKPVVMKGRSIDILRIVFVDPAPPTQRASPGQAPQTGGKGVVEP